MRLLPRPVRPAAFLRVIGFGICAGLFAAGALRAETTPAFAQAASDLKPDPAARFGALPNGVRYVVRANAEPKQRASLRLVVLAGSFMEKEQQRGLAHFLEHMAFNGSAHYPAGTLVEFFQRMGMNFGGDTNAYTSFDQTVYMLELPDTKAATLAEGLKVFSDYAGGLTLAPAEIDKERGVILSEKRTRDSVGYRTMLAELDFNLGNTLVAKRLPIGSTEVIEHAQRPEFESLYNAWYRPERLAVVAVGDFEAAAVEQQIKEAFSPLAARAPAAGEPALGQVVPPAGLRVSFHPEPEAPATTVSLSSILPYAHEADTAANRIRYLPRSLAVAMLNRRLSILAKAEGAPISSARTSVDEQFDFYREASIDATCKPEQWPAALGLIEQELRRALEHGFQAAELQEAVANFRNALEQEARTAPTRRSADIAGDIVASIVGKNVFTSPAEELALFEPVLGRVTLEDCAAALRESWSAPGRNLFVAGNTKIEGDAAVALTKAYEASRAVAVAAPEKTVEAPFAYTDFGAPGVVAKKEYVKDLDLTRVEFANGVRLNFKKTDFEANRIHLALRVGTGQLTEPRDEAGLGVFGGAVFTPGGLGKHSADDLQRILAGKTLDANFGVGSDALHFGGSTNREDLLLQCQLLAAYVTDPGYRAEALRQVRKGIEQYYNSLDHSPSGPLQREIPHLLASGDPRFGLPPREALMSRTMDELKAWLTPQLAKGAIEIAVVGDLDPDATIAAIAKTFGALPKREPKPALTEERRVSYPAQGMEKEFRVETKIPKAVVALYWPTDDASKIHPTRRLNLLASVFTDRLRLKVREELGGAYNPGVGSAPSDTYTGYGLLNAQVTVDPAQAAMIAGVVQQVAEDLRAKGVTDDELLRAKQPILTALRESARTNGYWLGNVLARAQEKPEVLDWCRSRFADFEGITKPEIDALASQYLGDARLCRFTITPIAPEKEPVATPTPVSAPAK